VKRIVIAFSLVGTLLVIGAGSTATQAEHASAPAGASRVDAARLSLGHGTSCVILDNGQARCWGNNNQGQAGVAVQKTPLGRDETPDSLPTVDVGSGRTLKEIDSGQGHGCGLMDNGGVRCWGTSNRGVIGVPGAPSVGFNEPPTAIAPVDLGAKATAISAGYFSTCAILEGGSVRCWGQADQGQLGYGNKNDIGDNETPASAGAVQIGGTATAITVGRFHACTILTTGFVQCWGKGDSLPSQPAGPTPDTVGDNELPTVIAAFKLGGENVTAVSAGEGSTCGLNASGDVYCWGSGTAARWSTGANTTPPTPTQVDLNGKKVVALDHGDEHVCVVFEDGKLTCWGRGADGRLGYANVKDVGSNAIGVKTPATVGTIDVGAGRTVKSVSAGFKATCAVLDNDTVRCWGHPDEIGSGKPFAIGDDETPGSAPVVNFIGTAAFKPLSPARVLDTRAGEPAPLSSPRGYVAPNTSIDVPVVGVGGVPNKDVYAVVLNVTLTQSGGPGFITAYASGTTRPEASNINVTGPGQTAPNLVIVPVGSDGKVSLYTKGGGHLVADVFGYFEQTGSSNDGRLIGVSPVRVFDTRPSEPAPGPKGKVGAGKTITVQITGVPGVPKTGVSAVVLNVTAAEATNKGFITVYPADVTRPTTSNLNLAGPGATRPNAVIVPISPDGKIKIYSQSGAHLLADVSGYFTDGSAPDTDDGLFVPLAPSRLLDSRSGGASPIPANGQTSFGVTGRLGIPSTANGVALNLTGNKSIGKGFVTGWPTDETRPFTSNLNIPGPNETIANMAILPLRLPSGRISLYTQSGTHLIADSSGYFL
jgi:alpha-tubulin suppressor-like RCC1 family protein